MVLSSLVLSSTSPAAHGSVYLLTHRSWTRRIGTGFRKWSFSRPRRFVTTRPASSSTFRCFMTPMRVIENRPSSALSVWPSSRNSSSSRLRRVGSARALNTASMGGRYVTVRLHVKRRIVAALHRRPRGPDIVRVLRAPVAQGIERCPAEAEVACSIHAGRISRRRSSRRGSNSREVAVAEPDHERARGRAPDRLLDAARRAAGVGEAGVFATFGDDAAHDRGGRSCDCDVDPGALARIDARARRARRVRAGRATAPSG